MLQSEVEARLSLHVCHILTRISIEDFLTKHRKAVVNAVVNALSIFRRLLGYYSDSSAFLSAV